MNESQYSTPLKTFVCRECGLSFDGPRRGSERRSCPQCRPAWREPHPRAGICAECGETFPPPRRGPVGARCPECKRRHRNGLGRGYHAVRRDERAAHPQPVDKTNWIQCPYCPDLMPSHHDRKQCGKPECRRAYHNNRCRASTRDYSHRYPEKRRTRRSNRRALERGVTGTHTTAFKQAQYKRQHGKCIWGRKVNPECAVSLEGGYHVDHVIPLAGERTSSNGPENIVLACPQCNGSKGAKDPMDWAGVMF